MLGWGSWANTQKLAGKQNWPFPLYYWDYAIGVFVFGLLAMFTLGSFGAAGAPALSNLAGADTDKIWRAVLSGVLFNISNILLVVAIDAAGMSVAFPVGVGIALVLGTVISYADAPKGNSVLLFGGVAFVVAAMVVSAVVHRRKQQSGTVQAGRGLAFAVVAGLLMGSFYPQLASTVSPGFSDSAIPDALRCFSALWRGLARQQLRGEYHFSAACEFAVPRLFQCWRAAAFVRTFGRRDLDVGVDVQCDCFWRGRPGCFLCAGPGRDSGGGCVGRLHLEGIRGRTGFDGTLDCVDASELCHRLRPDRDGDALVWREGFGGDGLAN